MAAGTAGTGGRYGRERQGREKPSKCALITKKWLCFWFQQKERTKEKARGAAPRDEAEEAGQSWCLSGGRQAPARTSGAVTFTRR